MSLEAAAAFRAEVDANPALQEMIRGQVAQGRADLLQLGAERGYQFSEQELRQLTENDELSDFELEIVAGGFQISTINSIKSSPN